MRHCAQNGVFLLKMHASPICGDLRYSRATSAVFGITHQAA
jgi:hypothetical protein